MFRFNCFWKAFSVYIVVVVGVFSRGANRQGRAVQGFDGGRGGHKQPTQHNSGKQTHNSD